jgi:ribosomal protein L11 methyltransferase
MSVYADSLKENGTLLLSGFYTEDIEMINESAESNGLKQDKKLIRNNWVGLKYVNLH